MSKTRCQNASSSEIFAEPQLVSMMSSWVTCTTTFISVVTSQLTTSESFEKFYIQFVFKNEFLWVFQVNLVLYRWFLFFKFYLSPFFLCEENCLLTTVWSHLLTVAWIPPSNFWPHTQALGAHQEPGYEASFWPLLWVSHVRRHICGWTIKVCRPNLKH